MQSTAAVGMGYGRVGLTAVALAEAIRSMGYNAIPSMNDTGLSVPMAIGRAGTVVRESIDRPALAKAMKLRDHQKIVLADGRLS